jgi:hypothetical protein
MESQDYHVSKNITLVMQVKKRIAELEKQKETIEGDGDTISSDNKKKLKAIKSLIESNQNILNLLTH